MPGTDEWRQREGLEEPGKERQAWFLGGSLIAERGPRGGEEPGRAKGQASKDGSCGWRTRIGSERPEKEAKRRPSEEVAGGLGAPEGGKPVTPPLLRHLSSPLPHFSLNGLGPAPLKGDVVRQ